MIKDVEGFEAQFEVLRFGKGKRLQERHIPIVQAGAVEETAVGVADNTERRVRAESCRSATFLEEQRCVEVRLPRTWIGVV